MLLLTSLIASLSCLCHLVAAEQTLHHFHSHRHHDLEARVLNIAQSNGNWLTLDELTEYTSIDKTVRDAVEATLEGRQYKWNKRGNMLSVEVHTRYLHISRNMSSSPRRQLTSSSSSSSTPHRPILLQRHQRIPQCLSQLYNFANVTNSTRPDDPSIGILAVSRSPATRGFRQSDLDLFLSRYRPEIHDFKPAAIEINGGKYSEDSGSGESALDTQLIAGLTAPTPIRFYVTGDYDKDMFATTFDYLMEDEKGPAVFAMAYGLTERTIATKEAAQAMCETAMHLTALGTTLVAASGDNGVNGATVGPKDCPPFIPTYPNGCPYILSVGATYHFDPEVVPDKKEVGFWGGGGFSRVFPRPDWQSEAVSSYVNKSALPRENFNAAGRGYPDVAAQGSLHRVILDGKDAVGDGTSASVNTLWSPSSIPPASAQAKER
ncbi:subtilisin-like protein [Jaminaea rosea]|uniref:Subtilisin-like protein n=1 Tax=Jaminaea rosea TaxID=1569628 RepID=A0A316ULN4_9BASI|nr:subtilisin-like protein [Jaminaea rosea]PWN25291.1 subtilisin-like protein [Jaminaea rosea]